MNSANSVKILYRSNSSQIMLGLLLFGACAIYFTVEALSNYRGLILNRIIELSTNGATIFYAVMAVSCWVFVICLVNLTMTRKNGSQVIEITQEEIVVPKMGFMKSDAVRIPFDKIINIRLLEINSIKFITILHENGEINIAANMCSNEEDFNLIYERLISGTTKAG